MARTAGCGWWRILLFFQGLSFLVIFLLEVSVVSSCLKPLPTVLSVRSLIQTPSEQNKMEQLSDKKNKRIPGIDLLKDRIH